MTIPSIIKIGAHTISIKYVEGLSDLANFSSDTNTIEIRAGLPESQMGAAFLHEVMHACNSVMGSSDLGHMFLDSFAEQLYQVLTDNSMVHWYATNRLETSSGNAPESKACYAG